MYPEARAASLPSAAFALFVHVLNAGLVDQNVGCACRVHLQTIFVVPLDDAVNFFVILQNQNHGSLGLHLFLVVKILGVRLFRRRDLLSIRRTFGSLGAFATISVFRSWALIAI